MMAAAGESAGAWRVGHSRRPDTAGTLPYINLVWSPNCRDATANTDDRFLLASARRPDALADWARRATIRSSPPRSADALEAPLSHEPR